MFTVKHIRETGDHFYFAKHIRFAPEAIGFYGDCGVESKGSVWLENDLVPGVDPVILNCGTVYIMNEMGKTISKYDLSGYELQKDDYGVTFVPK